MDNFKEGTKKLFCLTAGQKTWVGEYLDRIAARRILRSLIGKTNDFAQTTWLGQSLWQFPLDAWVLQEVLSTMRPDLIVETGTYCGGSAYFYATLFDLLNHGRVITIDIDRKQIISHSRITYLLGSSTDPKIVSKVGDQIIESRPKKVLFVFDSNHSADHVRQELESYASLAPVGSYLHIQDGVIDELSYFRGGRPGPKVAVKIFLEDHPEFIRDKEIETRYLLTAHPYGWLKKINV